MQHCANKQPCSTLLFIVSLSPSVIVIYWHRNAVSISVLDQICFILLHSSIYGCFIIFVHYCYCSLVLLVALAAINIHLVNVFILPHLAIHVKIYISCYRWLFKQCCHHSWNKTLSAHPWLIDQFYCDLWPFILLNQSHYYLCELTIRLVCDNHHAIASR